MVVAAGGPYGPAPQPLVATIDFNQGAGPFNVSGASGDLYSAANGVLVVIITGGTPPYSSSFTLEGDPSGKISLVPASDGVHTTIGWSGFSLNELEGCTEKFSTTDSVGATSTDQTPKAGSLIIKRTS
jgi:hypothetical protein